MGSIIEVIAASKMKSNVIKIQYEKMCVFKIAFILKHYGISA